MMSPICEQAFIDATRYGKALLKVISANDVDLTGAHQRGYYLPKEVWRIFTPREPLKGENYNHAVRITWHDGRVTNSTVKWYGQRTRNEFRLTGFGRDFPFRTYDNLGDILVLVPTSINTFNAYVLDLDEDKEELQAGLGVEIIKSWTAYLKGQTLPETADECLNRKFREFALSADQLPEGIVFSNTTLAAIMDCVPGFGTLATDEQLLKLIREEYNLYRMIERKVFEPEVQRLFASIDDFLETAQSILQTRKSRAGRSLENHIEYLLKRQNIPYQMRQKVDDTRPDILIPSKTAYEDLAFPTEKLFMIGVKTTCKDRWRQVTTEAPRITRKHILTLQEGISTKQLEEMQRHNVTLIVPAPLHKEYPAEKRSALLCVDAFIDAMKTCFSS